MTEPALEPAALVMADGIRLPLRVWAPAGALRAVVLALHGFNDYSNAFEAPARTLADHGIVTYAYDQRGFGTNPNPGLWPGAVTLALDARTALGLVMGRHQGIPVFVLGESMGGAVALLALAGDGAPKPAGAVLVAPALWGWSTLNPLYRATLWLTAHVAPGARFTGRGLGVQASDNVEMLIALGRDPLFIKETRAEAIYGLVHMMDDALNAPLPAGVPLLVLYGAHDEIIPPEPTRRFARRLGADQRFAYYGNGWHMLLRDLGAGVVYDDLLAWLDDRGTALLSGADVAAERFVAGP